MRRQRPRVFQPVPPYPGGHPIGIAERRPDGSTITHATFFPDLRSAEECCLAMNMALAGGGPEVARRIMLEHPQRIKEPMTWRRFRWSLTQATALARRLERAGFWDWTISHKAHGDLYQIEVRAYPENNVEEVLDADMEGDEDAQ